MVGDWHLAVAEHYRQHPFARNPESAPPRPTNRDTLCVVNRTEMIQLVSRRTKVPYATARTVIDGLLDVTATCLAADEEVNLRGFARFVPRQRKSRMRWNPKNGEPVEVPAHRVVAFIPSPLLKARINESD